MWGISSGRRGSRLAACLATAVLAATSDAQTITRGPIVQNPAALTTTASLIWWTNVAGNSTVDYGTTTSLGQSVTVAQAASCEVGAAGTCHRVDLINLLPGTRYYYRLSTNGVVVQNTTYFTTLRAPSDPTDLDFTVIGDWGYGSSAEQDLSNLQNTADAPLLLTVGDNAYQNGTQSDVDNNALAYYVNPLKRMQFFPALGNHDLNDVGGAGSYASSAWIKTLALPPNAPQPERYYAFDSGDARFIVLDSDSCCDGTQTAWLQNELATTPRRWKFVFLHHTPYSCATGLFALGSSLGVRNTWGPLLEQHGADVVFTGHDHSYERSDYVDDYLVGGSAGSDGRGTIYVMTGGGGATLDGAANTSSGQPRDKNGNFCHWIPQDCPAGPNGWCSISQYSYTAVTVANNQTATVTTYNRSGAVIDSFDVTKILCGNGVVDASEGEACDAGAANGTPGACCSASCQFVAAGTTCRTSAGACDPAETCSGASPTCPADARSPVGTVCRATAGACDVADTCDGSAAACPADAKSTAICRPAAGACDYAESCDGVANTCPADVLATVGTTCRAASGPCDLTESCTGSAPTCPGDVFVGAGTPCRAAAGACDPAETCDGASAACPADLRLTAGTVCRAAAGPCDVAETCDGMAAGCPADGKSTALCRAAAGPCDVAESCSGASDTCPPDLYAGSAVACRPAAGACDLAENCTGTSTGCPADGKSTAVCRPAAGPCDLPETCDGLGDNCAADTKSTAVCRPAAGACDVPESCDGAGNLCPADAFVAGGTTCRAAAGECDIAETCTGSSAVCPADGKSTAVCRPAAGPCDVAETCNGSGTTCPPDGFAAGGTECRAAAGVCDVAEACTGSSAACPSNAFVASGTTCRVSLGACDPAEACAGTGATCPADVRSTAVCRIALGPCDVPEACNGVAATCPADDRQPPGTTCRTATGPCDVAEVCDGTATTCPLDTGVTDGDGDAICDALDRCPEAADPTNADGDADGIGDACDPCTNLGPVFLTKPRISFAKLGTPGSDDRFKLSGVMMVPPTPPIDPLAVGFRILVEDAAGARVVDAAIPGSPYDATQRAGWKANGAATAWTYKNSGTVVPLTAGIYKIAVKTVGGQAGALKVSVAGKGGSYAASGGTLPLRATVIADPPLATSGQCGEATFPGPPPAPACTASAGGSTIRCK